MPAHALSFVGDQLSRISRGSRSASSTRESPTAQDVGRTSCPVTLVEEAQRGSRRAFDELWARYAPTVQSILLTMVDYSEADDLTQEVAVSAFRSLASLKRRESFPAWLCTIARNAGRDALAARSRSPMAPLEDAKAAELAAPPKGDPTAADEILAEIRKLPECHREPLMLRLLLEMTGPEIAEQTGMTPGSVRVNLCKGMKLLRQRLERWE
ncbi:MAG: sigma-70 family RNA polymerase sigma factor [Planctomycetes bacterium]|nr:sigma-70 family RNA polymerase sigma factor [Planctomycetota bacterium]